MPRDRVIAMVLGLALITAACADDALNTATSSGSTSSDVADTTTTTSSTATTTTTTTPIVSTTTTTMVSDPTLGLVTTTGLPVAVIDETANGHLVLSPCGFEVEVEGGDPLGPTSVVLDPGHGGPVDTGAVGANGLAEKDVNLRVAERAVTVLAERGIEAVLTRTGDYTTPLFVRANLADTLQADLMISVHHNAPTPGPSDKPGVEIFIQNESDDSARLGGLLWEHTRAALDVFDIPWTAAPDSGVMTVLNSRGDDAYGIIRHPDTPTALVELGYLSNPPEADLFAQPEYVRVAAASIATAIEEYLVSAKQGSGFVEGRTFNPNPGVSQDVCTDPDLG